MPVRSSQHEDFLIGADPEFLALNSDNEIVTPQGYGGTNVPLGADGGGDNFEIRPDPSYNPLEVVWNIRQCFLNKVAEKPKLLHCKWMSGSGVFIKNYDEYNGSSSQDFYPLGGHLHFGVKRLNARVTTLLLSQFLGPCTVLIESAKEAKRRRSHYYGYANDFREQPYGFEYRTPSSWLSSPYVAAAVLCLAKVVMFEILNTPKFRNPHYTNSSDIGNSVQLAKLKEVFPRVWKQIETMHLYPNYEPYLKLIPFLINNKLTWQTKASMQETWGITSPVQIKEKFSLESIWK
jgi:hypothetical protein